MNGNQSSEQTASFAPSVRLPSGHIVTPTGNQWLIGFAMAGCQWVIDALAAKEHAHD